MDHLLTLKPVRFLEGELIHDVSSEVHEDLWLHFDSPYSRIYISFFNLSMWTFTRIEIFQKFRVCKFFNVLYMCVLFLSFSKMWFKGFPESNVLAFQSYVSILEVDILYVWMDIWYFGFVSHWMLFYVDTFLPPAPFPAVNYLCECKTCIIHEILPE